MIIAINLSVLNRILFLIPILITFVLPYSVIAQNKRIIDSLKAVINAAEHDTSVCNASLILSNQIYLTNPDTALILCQNVYRLTEKNLTYNIGPILEKEYSLLLSRALNNIGFIYNQQGDIAKALEYLHKSLKLKEEIGNKFDLPTTLNNIGIIYYHQGDAFRALKYLHKSLQIYKEVDYQKGIAAALNNIGSVHDNQGDFLEALEYYHKSLKIQKDIGNQEGIASSLNNIGALHKDQGDTIQALECFYKSLKIKEEIGNKGGISLSLNNIGIIQYNQGLLDQAFNHGMQGLEIAREISSPYLISRNSGLLSKIAKKQRKFKEALEMYELHILMRDSINNERTQKATIRQQTKYEFEKAQLVKEQKEKEQTRIQSEVTARRDNLQYSVVLICLLVIGVLVAMLGKLSLSVKMAEGIIFFSFLILFEFLLVLADPYIENYSNGAPAIKLLFNAVLAGMIFPLHSLFESKMKKRLR